MAEYEINESLLRRSIKENKGTVKFPYTVAKKFIYKNSFGCDYFKFIIVYGKKTLTIAESWNEGYKRRCNILGKVQVTDNAEAYIKIAELIENIA